MSQHIPQQHHPQPHYVHYTPPTAHPFTHVAPKDTQHQPQPQQQPQLQQQPQPQPQQPQQQTAQGSASSAPLVATGDWTKDLVHLAKTAELKCVFIIDVSLVIDPSHSFTYHKTNYKLFSQKTCAYFAATYRPHLICSC
jgi:hypothetical protein